MKLTVTLDLEDVKKIITTEVLEAQLFKKVNEVHFNVHAVTTDRMERELTYVLHSVDVEGER